MHVGEVFPTWHTPPPASNSLVFRELQSTLGPMNATLRMRMCETLRGGHHGIQCGRLSICVVFGVGFGGPAGAGHACTRPSRCTHFGSRMGCRPAPRPAQRIHSGTPIGRDAGEPVHRDGRSRHRGRGGHWQTASSCTPSPTHGNTPRAGRSCGALRPGGHLCPRLRIGGQCGHDLDANNLRHFAANVPYLQEVSIGHALISDALYAGLEQTVKTYLDCLDIPSP